MEDKVSAGGVELVLKEEPSRVLGVVRVDEAEGDHHRRSGREQGEDGLLSERRSETVEERDRGRDKQERQDGDQLDKESQL